MQLVDNLNQIVLSHSQITFREDGIMEVVFGDNELLTEENCKELVEAYRSVLRNKKMPILHIAGKYMNVTKEAREFAASEEGLEFSLAEAFVFNSLPHRIIANFYINMNKPNVPTKFFKTKAEAEVWLKTFL